MGTRKLGYKGEEIPVAKEKVRKQRGKEIAKEKVRIKREISDIEGAITEE